MKKKAMNFKEILKVYKEGFRVKKVKGKMLQLNYSEQ